MGKVNHSPREKYNPNIFSIVINETIVGKKPNEINQIQLNEKCVHTVPIQRAVGWLGGEGELFRYEISICNSGEFSLENYSNRGKKKGKVW